MTEYGVQTNNIFDLLNAADDTRTGAKPAPRKKKGGAASGQPKKEGGQAKPQARPAGQVRATTVVVSGGRGAGGAPRAATQQAPAANAGRPAQGGNRRQDGDLARRFDESHVSFEEDKPKSVPHRHDGHPVVKHNPPNRGREFDRHSGTGRSPTENKKGGAGQGNWGSLDEKEELSAIEDVKADVQAESEQAQKEKEERKKNKKKKKKGKKGEEEEEKEKKDEVPDEQLKTFDDFLKEQAAKAAKLALPPARAAGEGVKEDPKWAGAVKREDKEEVFVPVKAKEEPKAKPEDEKKPSKAALKKRRKKERKQQEAKRLAEENIVNMFDFSAKKEDRPRGPRGPREGGNAGSRGPREGGSGRGPRGPREGGNGGPRGPREGGREGGSGRGPRGPRNPQQPRKYRPEDSEGPQFDASAFPALQVGPPPITVD